MRNKLILFVTTLFMAGAGYAEGSAPVYDADNYPPQFDGQSDTQGEEATAPRTVSEAASNMTASQRIARLEQRVSNFQNSESNMRVSSLQSEVQTLRGQVEELTHQLQQLQSQQKSIYSDLDKRVGEKSSVQPSSSAQLEQMNRQLQQLQAEQRTMSAELNKRLNGGKKVETELDVEEEGVELSDNKAKSVDPIAAVTAKEQQSKVQSVKSQPEKLQSSNAQPNAEEEQQIYQSAYNYIKEKKYTEAVTALKSMLQKYPSGQFAANAHYWLGELYGLLNDNAQSAKEFSIVIKNYSDSPKASDAQLKLAMIQASELKWKEAKAAFRKVISQYPGTTSAKVAAEQLKQIRLAGH